MNIIKHRGFTLLELMLTIAILGILIAIATPSFTRMVINHSVSSDQDTLFTLLLSARSEAINRGNRVTVCKSSNLTTCDNAAAWTDGLIIFSDLDGDGVIDAPGDQVIKVNEALERDISLSFLSATNNNINNITFNSLGRPEGTVGTFTFTHSSADAEYTRTIIITATGRARQG